MNIYLEEKDMPKNCVYCPFRDYEDACILQDEDANSAANNWDDLKRGCPLIPLLAQQETKKNEPLTLDELREMEGEAIPVWCDKVNGYVFIATTKTEPYNQVWFFNHKGFAYTVLYYHTKFYRRKPEEG